ncbi:MAG: hypothetical protein IKC08_02560 [Lentisphaeria bacterium]|nr:hypothetical protein [Lentisphaeria bacterium]
MCKKEQNEKDGGIFRIYQEYLTLEQDEKGAITGGSFHYPENFNFAYDVLDRIAEKTPDKPAII